MNRILPVIFVLLLFSCKTRYVTQTVEVPVIHVETRVDTVRDSVERHDSVTVYTKGDTVFSEKFRYMTKWKERVKIVTNTDTLTKIVDRPVPVYVEKELSKWQKIRMGIGSLLLSVLGLYAIYYIIKRFLWKK